MHLRSEPVPRLSMINNEHAPACPTQHQGGAESRDSTADHHYVPELVHVLKCSALKINKQGRLLIQQVRAKVVNMADEQLRQIGPRLRAARKERGLTLDQLAEASGISTSTLSRLESGKRQANLELLLPLTRELRIGLDELIAPGVGDPRIRTTSYRTHGMTVQPLSPPGAPLSTYKISYPARRRRPDLQSHDGYEWVYVLSGRLRLLLGEHDLVLEPGEAAEFDTRVPHAITATADGPAETINIFSESGARIHTRARPRQRSSS
jgi:transcriptional regulator with XRE-family HTH domain